MITRKPKLRPRNPKKDKTFFHRQQFNKFRKAEQYSNSWINPDGTINCGGIVYCDQPIPC